MRMVILSVAALAAATGGSLFVPHLVDVEDAPKRLDATDLDGDGDVDLFVLADVNGQAASLQVLLNDGGQFTPGWSATQSGTASPQHSWDLDLADTDGDGDADALYVVSYGSPYETFNDGSGSFSPAQELSNYAPQPAQEAADMDQDGNLDLVYFEEDLIGYLGTQKGDGRGGFEFDFSTETWFGFIGADFARRFELGDISGDGIPDTAMASTNGLQYMESGPIGGSFSGLPVWKPQVHLYTTACGDVALADFDGNSTLDIVATVPSIHSIVTFLKQPQGGFGPPRFTTAGAAPLAIAAADLDLDGHPDVAVTNPATGRVNVLLGTGTGTFKPPEDFRVGREPVDIVAADFDDDTDVDLAVACTVGGHVTVLINDTAMPQPVIEGAR